jgi:hypothetical protein
MNEHNMSDVQPQNHSLAETVAEHGAELTAIKGQMGQIVTSIGRIEGAISKSRETNWQTLFAGALVVAMIWAALINPLTQNADRQEKVIAQNAERQDRIAEKLADAVLVQTDKIVNLQITTARLSDHQESIMRELDGINKNGTVQSDKRLSLLEYQINHITKTP